MDALATRVRDRHLIRVAVEQVYTTEIRTASWCPPQEAVHGLVEGFWEPRLAVTDREAFGGITRTIGRLLTLFRKAPRAWDLIKAALGIGDLEGLSLREKVTTLGRRFKELATEGKKALGKALRKALNTFPLSIFFVSKQKAPGLTALVARILQKSPRLRAVLEKVRGGAEKLDVWLKKYIPNMSRGLYAAVFIWVWMNVSELSWDVQAILAGFTGRISLGELLASMPESGVGLIAASFGLGYGALPYAVVARLIWLVANRFITWVPGKGFKVHWSKMEVPERDEVVPAF